LIAVALVVFGALGLLPLIGWPAVTRVSVVLLAGFLLALALVRPWRWRPSELAALGDWAPSARTVWTGAAIVGVVLFWFVLTRFRSGEINAVDFTVYYDRPAYQTVLGRPMFVETADDVLRAQQTYFSVHAHWVMLPLSAIYAIHATPLWLLAVSVLAVVAGAVNVLRIVQRIGGGGLVASASALAFVLNDNTARTLNYGFHVEVLYAWLVPWMINTALAGHRRTFLVAAVACVAVKEDAFLPLSAVSAALALAGFASMTRRDRFVYLIAPPLMALLNLGVYYAYLLPRLRSGGVPFYAHYWASYGDTPSQAILGMLGAPWRVLSRTVTSAFFTRVLMPHLFLPLVGWRWTLGILPIVVLHGASDNEQMRAFGIYYAIVLVPFLVIATAAGALVVTSRLWTNPVRARLVASVAILLGALLAGISNAGYSLRPWKAAIGAVPIVLAQLSGEPVVLVQSGLYPHAGYESRIQLLTPEALASPTNAGAAILLAPAVSGWPIPNDQLASLARLPPIAVMPQGLVAVRVPRP
jgi:uncharacterized membrane protein